MIDICTHIKSDGIRCGSPAMRGHSRCYFHLKDYNRNKPRRQPTHPPRMSSGVLYVFQTLERATTDEVLSTKQLLQAYKQAQRAMRRHLERLKRPLLQTRNAKCETRNGFPNPTPASAVTAFTFSAD